jgi:hypothetical protein
MEKKIKLPELEAPVLPAHAGDRPAFAILLLIVRLLVK